jgi:hypothetical protein
LQTQNTLTLVTNERESIKQNDNSIDPAARFLRAFIKSAFVKKKEKLSLAISTPYPFAKIT